MFNIITNCSESPSKWDRDVSIAIDKNLVNEKNYPYVSKWLQSIEQFPANLQKRLLLFKKF